MEIKRIHQRHELTKREFHKMHSQKENTGKILRERIMPQRKVEISFY